MSLLENCFPFCCMSVTLKSESSLAIKLPRCQLRTKCRFLFCCFLFPSRAYVLSSWPLAAHPPLEKPWPQFLFWRRCETAFKATAFTLTSLRNTICIVRQNNIPGCELSNFKSYLWPATTEQLHHKYTTTT